MRFIKNKKDFGFKITIFTIRGEFMINFKEENKKMVER